MSKEFWRDLPEYGTDIIKTPAWVDKEGRQPAIRLYCTQHGERWNLQTRGPLRLANGSNGKDAIIASTSLSVEDMLALLDAIEDALDDAGVER